MHACKVSSAVSPGNLHCTSGKKEGTRGGIHRTNC